MMKRLGPGLLLPLLLVACQPEAPPDAQAPGVAEADVAPPQAPVAVPVLEDVVETDPRYLVGITYPPEANKYPGLTLELQRYVDEVRGDLMAAVEGAPADSAAGPYDLSLTFSTVADTPAVFAIAADGSSYTGGAHGAPLMARFVWLPEGQRVLRASDLFQAEAAWRDLSAYVREQLHAALSQRVDADDLDPVERERIMRSAGRMIDQGSGPDPANFRNFEPVIGTGGAISALRFVFPPYQVGPYSDGVQTVEVPAALLRPHVAQQYKALFAGG